MPALHVDAACASNAVAVRSAAQWGAAGRHDVVLVVGAEQHFGWAEQGGGPALPASGGTTVLTFNMGDR